MAVSSVPDAFVEFYAISSVPDAFVKFHAISSVPDAFVKKCLPSPASRAVVLDAGPLLEPPVPPLVRLRGALGPCCGASVGTTGSAPRALACRRLRTKFHKICSRS